MSGNYQVNNSDWYGSTDDLRQDCNTLRELASDNSVSENSRPALSRVTSFVSRAMEQNPQLLQQIISQGQGQGQGQGQAQQAATTGSGTGTSGGTTTSGQDRNRI